MYQPLTAQKAMELAEQMGNWKLPFMQLVDDFRREPVEKKVALVVDPVSSSQEKWLSLLKAIINHLCDEAGLEYPPWAFEMHWLPEPWFVAEFKSLYAIAIAESPLFFRRNNIFVTKDFLTRC